MINLFAKMNVGALLLYLDLLDIVWREQKHFPGNINSRHRLGAINSLKLSTGCLLDKQHSKLCIIDRAVDGGRLDR